MGRFYLELTGNERLLLLFALGHIYQVPALIAYTTEPPADGVGLANRIANLPETVAKPAEKWGDVLLPRAPEAPPSASPGTAPGHRPGAVETLKLQSPRPAGSHELVVPLVDSVVKSESGDRLAVSWKGGRANCWDSKLFPAVLKTLKQPATFYVNSVVKGAVTYLNIVGVK
jgi:hypothetical protein